MPNCFTLSRKAEPGKPISFITIDEELCAALGKPCDPNKYYLGWYDMIGFRLAMGQSFDDIQQYLIHDCSDHHDWAVEMLRVSTYLREHFVSDAWAEIGNRA